MSCEFCTRDLFGEDVGSLLWISAIDDGDVAVLYKFMDPVPADIDMFGTFVEFWVLCHRY